jgi:hypothetical protein
MYSDKREVSKLSRKIPRCPEAKTRSGVSTFEIKTGEKRKN